MPQCEQTITKKINTIRTQTQRTHSQATSPVTGQRDEATNGAQLETLSNQTDVLWDLVLYAVNDVLLKHWHSSHGRPLEWILVVFCLYWWPCGNVLLARFFTSPPATQVPDDKTAEAAESQINHPLCVVPLNAIRWNYILMGSGYSIEYSSSFRLLFIVRMPCLMMTAMMDSVTYARWK